jgi:hypothetical protein
LKVTSSVCHFVLSFLDNGVPLAENVADPVTVCGAVAARRLFPYKPGVPGGGSSMFRPRGLWFTCVVVVASLAAAPARADDSWVGKRVMPKHAGVTIGHTDKNDQEVVDAKLNQQFDYKVEQENGPWINSVRLTCCLPDERVVGEHFFQISAIFLLRLAHFLRLILRSCYSPPGGELHGAATPR